MKWKYKVCVSRGNILWNRNHIGEPKKPTICVTKWDAVSQRYTRVGIFFAIRGGGHWEFIVEGACTIWFVTNDKIEVNDHE